MQMPLLRVTLLGWPEVVQVAPAGETTVPDFASLKVQAMLYYLVITDQPAAREKLIGLLWPEVPQQKARTSLRSALYNIQRALPDVLHVTRKSASLSSAYPLELDVARFETEIESQEATLVSLAVSRYNGDFLEGFVIEGAPEFDYWMVVERERLRHKMLAGLTWLIEQDTAAGRPDEAARMLRRLLALERWREVAHRQLMHTLARQGKYNAALRQYRECQQVLAGELGVSPMPETTALYERIQQLRQRPPQTNLPALPDIIGRETELADLQRRLLDPETRLVTLTGPGGVGKTRLALAAAAHQPQFMDGVFYASLAAVSHLQFLITTIADAIGLAFTGSEAPQNQLLNHLRSREMLLVLDNLEQLLDSARFLTEILQTAPEITLLVTSREPLQLRAEWVFPLEGLPLPPPDAHPEAYAAVRLFARRARQVQPSFDLVQEAIAVVHICRLLDGLPLGLELAAALRADFTCAQIAAEIERNLDILQASWSDAPDRHRSLHALFEHTWQLLTPAQQEAFCRLSVFRGQFTAGAAQAVAGTDREVLRTLSRKSLLWPVTAEERAAAPRYAIHETLRQYGARILAEKPEAEMAVRRGHIDFYTRLLDREPAVFAQEIVRATEAELDNIRAAWEWAGQMGDFAAIGRAMHALHQFYEARNWFQEGQTMFTQAKTALAGQIDLANSEQRVVWGRLLGHCAALLWRGGRLQDALPLARQSAEILRQEQAVQPLLFSLNVLGVLHIYCGDFEAAAAVLQECARTARQVNDPLQQLKPLANLGSVYMRTGDYDAGEAVLQEGLALARQVGDRRGRSFFLNNLGTIAMLKGKTAAAATYFEKCLAVAREINNKYAEMVALLNLGEIDASQRQFADAEQSCRAAVALGRELGDAVNTARGLKWLALVQHGQGRRNLAWEQVHQALSLLEVAAEPARLYVLAGAAQMLADEGQREEAIQLAAYIQQHTAAEKQSVVSMLRLLSQLGVPQPPRVDELPEAWKEESRNDTR